MMNAEIKAKWLAALRSGRYSQARGRLFNGAAFCCLGVLCDTIDHDGWSELSEDEAPTLGPDNFSHPFGDSNELLDPHFRDEIGIPAEAETKLTHMNDGENGGPPANFTEIAEWIEENL